MIVVSGTIYIDPKKRDQAIELAKVMMEKTAEEPGCISYRFYEDIESPGNFRVFEEWESEADLEAHFQTEHMLEFRPAIAKIAAAPPNIRKYAVSDFELL